MKYTKEFEKYWKKSNKDIDMGDEYPWEIWDDLKIASFRAWKAGIEKTKRNYDLHEHRNMTNKFLPF
jgi:hypothetical protein